MITFYPSRGVRTPTVPSKPRQIITQEQLDAIYRALPSADMQLLVDGRRKRAALGRTDRTTGQGPFTDDADPYDEPQGDRGQPEVRTQRQALRG